MTDTFRAVCPIIDPNRRHHTFEVTLLNTSDIRVRFYDR